MLSILLFYSLMAKRFCFSLPVIVMMKKKKKKMCVHILYRERASERMLLKDCHHYKTFRRSSFFLSFVCKDGAIKSLNISLYCSSEMI